tara:strand:+ start:1661 stop:1831 length:171 start_codon:yes stop_codon:yes gene_type:complete
MVDFFTGFFVALIAVVLVITVNWITKENWWKKEEHSYEEQDEFMEILKWFKGEGTK